MNRSAASTSQARHSSRIESSEALRVLDESSRNRRLKRQLAALDQDNAHDDPHANLVWNKAIPKFDDGEVGGTPAKRKKDDDKKKRKFRAEHTKQRFRKTFAVLLEEFSQANKDDPQLSEAYLKATAPPSTVPPRHFCAACGFPSKYTCIRCGARYCCLACRNVHNDTRCMKWTA